MLRILWQMLKQNPSGGMISRRTFQNGTGVGTGSSMIDANARVGEYPSGLVGDHDADPQDDNGALFTEYLARGGTWLASTFSTLHDGDSGTWWHQQSGRWTRGDFIGLSTSLPLTSCSSKDLGLH